MGLILKNVVYIVAFGQICSFAHKNKFMDFLSTVSMFKLTAMYIYIVVLIYVYLYPSYQKV